VAYDILPKHMLYLYCGLGVAPETQLVTDPTTHFQTKIIIGLIIMFTEILATKKSIQHRSSIYGIGINDADYIISFDDNGKQQICPYYSAWSSMIRRCYSANFLKTHGTYKDCTVVKEWLTFSKFKQWMESQEWEGYHLDKDIINPKNKLYSPDNCCFVSPSINMLLTNSAAKRGKYPQGVQFFKRLNKFVSAYSYNGKTKHIGVFNNQEDAEQSYKHFKRKYILELANDLLDDRVKNGLKKHAELLISGAAS